MRWKNSPVSASHVASHASDLSLEVRGFALTVRLKKEENHDPDALQGMLAAIDGGGPNSVYVMVVDDGIDIAGMGGLMGTAMAARNFSGAVIDGGVRDTAYLQKIGFPVFALGPVPSTSVSHYRFAGANIPLTCDGIPVAAAISWLPIRTAWSWSRALKRRMFSPSPRIWTSRSHSMYAYIEKLSRLRKL